MDLKCHQRPCIGVSVHSLWHYWEKVDFWGSRPQWKEFSLLWVFAWRKYLDLCNSFAFWPLSSIKLCSSVFTHCDALSSGRSQRLCQVRLTKPCKTVSQNKTFILITWLTQEVFFNHDGKIMCIPCCFENKLLILLNFTLHVVFLSFMFRLLICCYKENCSYYICLNETYNH